MPWTDQLRDLGRRLASLLYTKVIALNIFPLRYFPHGLDRNTAKTLGQWSTRLHFFLLVVTFVVLGFQVTIRPELLTKTYSKPTLDLYTQLDQKHRDSLECPCALISSPYREFVTIEAIFHQVSDLDHQRDNAQLSTQFRCARVSSLTMNGGLI